MEEANPRRTLFALTATLLGLLAVTLLVEGLAATQDAPRVQQVSLYNSVRMIGDVPVWRDPRDSPARENVSCEGRRTLLFGSSILYGSGLEAADSIGPHLQEAIPGTCVENYAQPGFTFANQWAVAQERLAEPPAPVVVVWEIWQNSINTLDVIGSYAYNFGELKVDSGGVPSVFGLTAGANRALFARSATYRYLTLRLAETRPAALQQRQWEHFADTSVREALVASRRAGREVVMMLMPPLDRPFAESAAAEFSGYAPIRRLADNTEVTLIDVAAELSGRDVEALRLDPCCHYNPEGQRALAEILAPVLAPAFAEVPQDGDGSE